MLTIIAAMAESVLLCERMKADCVWLFARCKIGQSSYFEGGSEDHLMSSTGKYCVRELAAA
jgi:hypothetical protein